MSFLLDTNIVSELRQPRGFNPHVIEWVQSETADNAWLSVITILEIQRGILLLQPRDPRLATKLAAWLDNIVSVSFAGRILPVDADVALACAKLHVPKMRPYADSLIAATALVHDLTLVTRNVADFSESGVRIFNPWAD